MFLSNNNKLFIYFFKSNCILVSFNFNQKLSRIALLGENHGHHHGRQQHHRKVDHAGRTGRIRNRRIGVDQQIASGSVADQAMLSGVASSFAGRHAATDNGLVYIERGE